MVICKSPTSLHKGHLHPQLLVSLEPLVLVLFGFGRSTVVCFSNISLALCQCCVLFQMEGPTTRRSAIDTSNHLCRMVILHAHCKTACLMAALIHRCSLVPVNGEEAETEPRA